MSRRSKRKKSSSSNPLMFAIVAVVAIAILAGGYYLITRDKSSFEEYPAYDGDTRSLAGNKYQITGKVTKVERNDADRVIVSVQQDEREHSVQVEISKNIDGPNINKEQSYIFEIEVDEDGMNIASAYRAR